jgi:YHS domain-containing protein
MTSWSWPKRIAALAGVLLLAAWLINADWCEARDGQMPSQFRQSYPVPASPCPNNCTPKANTWGHYSTKWRRWPGDQPMSETNPRALGKELLPTPAGREEVPLPRTVMPKPLPPQQEQPFVPQGEAAPPPVPSEIVPPEGLLIPHKPTEELLNRPTRPAAPAEPIPSGELPGLPGLPPEPSPSIPESKPMPPVKPKEQPPKPETPKKSEKPDAAMAMVRPAERPKIASPKSDRPNTERRDMATLVGCIEPEHPRLPNGVQRVESIATEAPRTAPNRVEPAGFTTVESTPVESMPVPVIPPEAMPRVALGGYCPVELSQGRWTAGDLRWTVVHNGWVFRLSGTEQRQRFLANPESFVPANSSNDPVLSVEENRVVPGQLTYCAQYDGRLYMFSSSVTQEQFNKNPQRYAGIR